MIMLVRILIMIVWAVPTFVFGTLYMLTSPCNPKHTFWLARWFCRMAPVLGIKLEMRLPENYYQRSPALLIGNHQNNFDLFTLANAVVPGVVTVGKKSLIWIPLFGLIYWLSGNVLIDRANRKRAIGTIGQVADEIKKKGVSIWMFPEGTRSRGRGLLPFKTGAFHAAMAAEVPVVPVVCSTTTAVNLNRWNNGKVIVEVMPEIDSSQYTKATVHEFARYCHDIMKVKLDELDAEIAAEKENTK